MLPNKLKHTDNPIKYLHTDSIQDAKYVLLPLINLLD